MTGALFTASRFRRALRWFIAGRLAQALATLALTLLAIRLLPLTDYGTYMVLWGIVELGMPLTSLGLLPAVQRFLPEYAARGSVQGLRRFVRLALCARLGMLGMFCLLLLGSWPAISGWLGVPYVRGPVSYAAAGVVMLVLTNRFVAEMLECLLEQRFAQAARALVPIGRLGGLLALWLAGHVTLLNVLLVDFAAAALALLLAEVWLSRQLRALRPSGEASIVSARELLQFIWHMSAAQLLSAVSGVGAIRLIVAKMLGIELAGLFAFLQQLMAIAGRYLPSTLLANMVRPLLISRHAHGHLGDVAVGHGLLWKLNVATAWPVVAIAVVAGEPLLAWLSGGRMQDAAWPFVVLLVALVGSAQTQVATMALQVARRTDLVRDTSAMLLLAPMLAWALAPLGLHGAAIAVAVASLALSGAAIWSLQRLPERAALDVLGVARLLAALLVATIVGLTLRQLLPWPLIILAMLATYTAGIVALRPLTAPEFELLQRALGRRSAWFGRLVQRRGPLS